MHLARVGPLPTIIVTSLFGVVFLIFAVIVVLTKVSERRLKLFSIIIWLLLVLQQYSIYAVQIHHHPSTSVFEISVRFLLNYSHILFLQIDSTILVIFFTYFVIPLSLRIATGFGITLSLFHLLVATAVPFSTPVEVLIRQVQLHFYAPPFSVVTFLSCSLVVCG